MANRKSYGRRAAHEVVAIETNKRLWEAFFTIDEGKAGIERLRRILNDEPYEEPEEDHEEVLRRLFDKPETEPVYESMPKNFSETDTFYAHGMGVKLELDGI